MNCQEQILLIEQSDDGFLVIQNRKLAHIVGQHASVCGVQGVLRANSDNPSFLGTPHDQISQIKGRLTIRQALFLKPGFIEGFGEVFVTGVSD